MKWQLVALLCKQWFPPLTCITAPSIKIPVLFVSHYICEVICVPYCLLRLDHSLTFQGLSKAEGKLTTKSKTGDIAPLIKTATWLLLERSSPQHWQIIKEWLLASIKRRFGQKLNQIMANCSGPLEKFTHSLQENVETIMSAMFTHPLMAEVTALYEGLTDPEQGKQPCRV